MKKFACRQRSSPIRVSSVTRAITRISTPAFLDTRPVPQVGRPGGGSRGRPEDAPYRVWPFILMRVASTPSTFGGRGQAGR